MWNTIHEYAFKQLKENISSALFLAHFDPSAPTMVIADASGAVMSPWSEGNERTVAFAFETLSETERKYSTIEQEALAYIFAGEHWHVFLYGRKFTL